MEQKAEAIREAVDSSNSQDPDKVRDYIRKQLGMEPGLRQHAAPMININKAEMVEMISQDGFEKVIEDEFFFEDLQKYLIGT